MIDLPVIKLDVSLKALESFDLPGFWGGLLRGALDTVMERRLCRQGGSEKGNRCRTCPHQSQCAYCVMLVAPGPDNAAANLPRRMQWAKGYGFWAQPLFFHSADWSLSSGPVSIEAGRVLRITYFLAARAVAMVEPLVAALHEVAAGGLGPRRGKLAVVSVGPAVQSFPVEHSHGLSSYRGTHLTIEFITPIQWIKARKKAAQAPSMEALCANLLRRLGMMQWLATGTPLAIDPEQVLALARQWRIAPDGDRTRHVELSHYSASQSKSIDLGGHVGTVTYEGPDMGDPSAELLELGQFVGAGKKTSYGLGYYRLHVPVQPAESRLPCTAKPKLDLFQQIIAPENLLSAWEQLRRRSRSEGSGGPEEDRAFSADSATHLSRLARELARHQYVPSPYIVFEIDKGGGEQRPISRMLLRDKVAQQAFRQVVEPHWDALFCDFSYGYRPAKGAAKAVARARHAMVHDGPWALSADIDDFFDRIDHDLLIQMMAETGLDGRSVELAALWVLMGGLRHQRYWKDRLSGVPQGAVISPLLSNLYLNPFDHHMQACKISMVRYADDFLLTAKTHAAAMAALDEARKFLSRRLKLSLKAPSTAMDSAKQGVPFLGVLVSRAAILMSEEKLLEKKEEWLILLAQWRARCEPAGFARLEEKIKGWQRYYFKLLCEDAQRAFYEEIGAATAPVLDDVPRPMKKQLLGLFESVEARLPVKATARREIAGVETPSEQNEAPVTDSRCRVARARRKTLQEIHLAEEVIVDRPGVFLGKKQRFMVAKFEGKPLFQKSLARIRHVLICCNGVSFSSNLLRACAQREIPLDLMDNLGNLLCRMTPPMPFMAQTGLAQLRALEDGKGASLAVKLVFGKVRNQLALLRYLLKYKANREKAAAVDAAGRIEKIARVSVEIKLAAKPGLDALREQLMALEAEAARHYWKIIGTLVSGYVPGFDKRVHQGAGDLFNQLLNYGYGILYSRVLQAIMMARLNPAVSYLHAAQDKKPTLAFDLIEEFRSPVVDRAVIALVRRGVRLETENDRLSHQARRAVIGAVMSRLHAPVIFRGKELGLAGVIVAQVRSAGKFLKGEVPAYRPYAVKW